MSRFYPLATAFCALLLGCAVAQADVDDEDNSTDQQALLEEGVGDIDPSDGQPAAPALGPSGKQPLKIYITHGGSDKAAGDAQHPLATLGGAQSKLEKDFPQGLDRNVEIRVVASDKAYSEAVEWTYYSPDYTISFMPSTFEFGMRYGTLKSKGDRPIFNGKKVCSNKEAGSKCRFFHGQVSNVRFYYLDIRRYSTSAISLHDSEGHNLVYGCLFTSIGNKPDYFHKLDFGMSAVGLNTSDSLVKNNHFVNLLNKAGDERFLHAVYMNHSSRNRVVWNSMLRVCGDPIKVRNFANDNIVKNNRFRRTGKDGFFLDWPEGEERCSWRNLFTDNALESGYTGSINTVWLKDGCTKCKGNECEECKESGCSNRVKHNGNDY